jgi:TPR repeat protein
MRALLAVVSMSLAGSAALAQTDAQALGCAAGRFEDCRRLMLHVAVNGGTRPDLEDTYAPVFDQARAVFEAACDRGDASDSGCFGAGFMHARKIPGGLARAVMFYERSCSGRYAAGCTQVGNAYTAGIDADVPWDIQRALAAYERACAAGDPAGCTIVAKVLEGAPDLPPDAVRRVPRDLKRAASLYQKACDMGAMRDCLRLAEMYERGLGVRKDAARAGHLYARACEAGETAACGRGRNGRRHHSR